MTTIQLTRIVKPGVTITNGVAHIENRVKTVCVTLKGPYGGDISLAFDGRFDCADAGNGAIRETYAPYADCPVMTFNGKNGNATDVEALRALRDALVAMDLDDTPVVPVVPTSRYRLREYNRSGSTSFTYSDDYDALSNRLDEGVDAGCLAGGDIDEFVKTMGWVVCPG
jgi:hypothetical protein